MSADAEPSGTGAAAPEAEHTRVARRAGVVASGTLASRVLGAVRDMVVAAVFGITADAFWVAFTIPNALRALLGEGAVANAFVPVFSEVREREGLDRAKRFFAALTGAMILILALTTLVGLFGADLLVWLYAAGELRDPAEYDTTVTLTRLVFPYIFWIGLAALGVGALNALKQFAVPAFAPVMLNVAFIVAAFTLVPTVVDAGLPPTSALAIGALVGGVLQLAVLLPSLRRRGLLLAPTFGFRDPYVRKVIRLMVPLLAGIGVYQANVLLSRRFASYLYDGAQSYLFYSQRLVEIPQGMFALAIASAVLPSLSELRHRGELEEVKRLFRYGLRLALFVAVPSAVALAVLAEPTTAVLFGRGEFGPHDVFETARSLFWMALGVWAVASVRTVVPLFFALNDTRTPVLASGLNLATFTTVSVVTMDTMGHAGIALGMTAAAVVQMTTLLALLRRKAGRLGLREVAASLVRIVAASAVSGAVAWLVAGWGAWARGGNDPLNVAVFTVAVVTGAASYLLAARILRAPELDELLRAARRRRS